jgi:uncharacterized protein (DUF952 family)
VAAPINSLFLGIVAMMIAGLSKDNLLHVVPASTQLPEAGDYFPQNFSVDGFIHLCEVRQLPGVLLRFFQAASEAKLLVLDSKKLSSKVVFEAVDNDRFPHLFGGINQSAIVSVQRLIRNSDGTWQLC